VRVRWRPDLRAWVSDPRGIPEAEARRHGFIALSRPYRRRWRKPRVKLLVDKRAARLAAEERAERQAAARERRRAYHAVYWITVGKARRAERRAADPAALPAGSRAEESRRWRERNPDGERAKAKRYREGHREIERARHRRWRAARRAASPDMVSR
jgi:hypothetical protein